MWTVFAEQGKKITIRSIYPAVFSNVHCFRCHFDPSDNVLFVTAMTTSKWDILEAESDGEKDNGMKGVDEDIDGA